MKVEKEAAKQFHESSFRLPEPVKTINQSKIQKITKKKNKILDLKFSVGGLKYVMTPLLPGCTPRLLERFCWVLIFCLPALLPSRHQEVPDALHASDFLRKLPRALLPRQFRWLILILDVG